MASLFRAISLLLALTISLLASPGTPAWSARVDLAVQRDTPPLPATTNAPFSASPPALAVTLGLGQVTTVQLTITNTSASTATLHLYEAWPPAAAGAATRGQKPAGPQRVTLPSLAERIDTQITQEMADSADGSTEFLVFLADQPDLAPAYQITDWNQRGWFVYRTLFDNAERSQRDLRAWLEQRGIAYHPLWIANALLVRGDTADLQAIASRTEVAAITANQVAAIIDQRMATPDVVAPGATLAQVAGCQTDGTCWHLSKIDSYRTWADFGVTGQGITVANIDTGVAYSHPALLAGYRGYGGSGTLSHAYNWFDPSGTMETLEDRDKFSSHGTHTMGTMVGRGTTGAQPAVGVAPGARWIAAVGCLMRDSLNQCALSDLMDSAQWLLAPTDLAGNNPRPDLRPHIINNSWAGKNNSSWYAGYVAAWRASGIFPVFAAGNYYNSQCGLVGSPADYANVVAVGATNQSDRLAAFSAAGPAADGRLKPDLTAPGVDIPSTVALANGSPGYATRSGTSMAAPQVAGAVALIWSANPSLIGDYEQTYAILTGSAAPLPDTRCGVPAGQSDAVPNNLYGYGRLDAYAAVARARIDIPWLDLPASTETLAAGASGVISVTLDGRRAPGPGTYTARIVLHSDDLTETPAVVPVTLTIPDDLSYGRVAGSVHHRETGAPLAATVSIDDGPVVRADSNGAFAVTLPSRTIPYTITAQATGFLPQTQQLVVTPALSATLAFTLTPDVPRLAVDTRLLTASLTFNQTSTHSIMVRNAGELPVEYSVLIPDETYGVWRSDEPDGPPVQWIEPPGAAAIALRDDEASAALPLGFSFPFYGEHYTSVYLSPNGMLMFEAPAAASSGFTDACLPAPDSAQSLIAPFRADLNPAEGGEISYAQIDQGFVVTYRNVPLYTDPEQRYTFQVLLHRDGRIGFNYQRMAETPANASFGIQRNAREAQPLGCGDQMGVGDDLSIELRPQIGTARWLRTTSSSGMIESGQAVDLNVTVVWTYPVGQIPYSGAVLLRSNTPQQPVVRVPIRLWIEPPPHDFFLPLFRGM